MPRIILALLTLCLSALCLTASAAAQGVVGEWAMDIDTLLKSPELAKLEPKQRETAIMMARTSLSKMRLVVAADGTLRMQMTPSNARSGTWKALDKGAFELTIDKDPATAKVAGDRLTISPKSGRSELHFVRAKATPAKPSGPPIDFVGVWTIDGPATLQLITDPKQKEVMRKGMGIFEGMTMTFTGGKMTMVMGGKTRSGTYEHRATAAGVTIIDTKQDGKDRIEALELSRKGERLHVTADGNTLVFKR